ncbi:MAG: hypothetical protein HY716_13955 [Planctomycetes bacterium]|nr:hypothetical protein [Planctomycetota bacterium]
MALGFVLAAGFSAVLFAVSAVLLREGFRRLDPPVMWEFIHFGFVLLYGGWIYLASSGDLYDPGRLAPYPISPHMIFLGSALSSFLGFAPLFAVGLFAGWIAGAGGTALEFGARAALLVALILHLQMVARLIRLTFLNVLTSRGWRDAMLLMTTLAGGVGFILATSDVLDAESVKGWTHELRRWAETGRLSPALSWCPGVWFSWAYSLEGARAAGGAVAFLLATGLVVRWGGKMERRLAFSEPLFAHRRRAAETGAQSRFLSGVSRAIASVVGSDVAAVARKEISVFLRDPIVRHRLLTSLFYVFLPILAPVWASKKLDFGAAPELAGSLLIFGELFFLVNQFGTEGSAARTLLSLPTSRRRILLGKNLAYGAIFLPFNITVLSAVALLASRTDTLWRDLAHHTAALGVVMAGGNLVSIFFPMRFLAPGQRLQRQEEFGCWTAVAWYVMLAWLLALAAPAALASLLIDRILGPAAALATAPLALAYAGLLYAAGLRISETALRAREERLADFFRCP